MGQMMCHKSDQAMSPLMNFDRYGKFGLKFREIWPYSGKLWHTLGIRVIV